MSLIIGKYIKNAVKSPIQKVVDSVVTQAVTGNHQSVSSIATSFSKALFNIGQSFDSISAISALKVDSVVSRGSNDYAGFAGKCVERSSGVSTGHAVRSGSSSRDYVANIAPQGKIGNSTYAAQPNLDVYPPDIGKFQLRLDFAKYERPTPFANVTTTINYSLVLPVPRGLSEEYGVEWSEVDTELIGDIADAWTRTRASGGKDTLSAIGQAGVAQVIRSTTALGGLAGSAAATVAQMNGVVPNPNISVMFKGPRMRSHDFSWTFSPHTPQESKKLQSIIKQLKNRMLSRHTRDNVTTLLGYPEMVKPSLHPKVDGGEGLYEFKMCVIESVRVQYGDNGPPSFFKGTNLPTTINLRIALKEIEYFLSEYEGLFDSNEFSSNALVGRFNEAVPDLNLDLKPPES